MLKLFFFLTWLESLAGSFRASKKAHASIIIDNKVLYKTIMYAATFKVSSIYWK